MALNRRRKPPFESIVVVSCIHDAIFIGGNHRNVNESIGLLACLWSTNAQNSWRWDGANQRLSIVAYALRRVDSACDSRAASTKYPDVRYCLGGERERSLVVEANSPATKMSIRMERAPRVACAVCMPPSCPRRINESANHQQFSQRRHYHRAGV
jgi:hypothetical protein